ncbi:MAG TPA: type II 3-dehydroquinate dehydratase [Lapillicoccus sp.]|jgi:3-dehydroquinate dehydratase-2|nr:type II 3-dehydroquinate dehydratase [Lapillicoccus sp.]
MARPIIAVLNGPNLNLLGERDPEIYGSETLADVEARCAAHADGLGFDVDCRHTNREGELVDMIHELRHGAGIVINAGGYSHTSVAIRDALATVTCPVVEVHISNVHAREPFRHHSYISAVATGVIVGLGTQGYELAIEAVAARVATA